MFCTNCGTQLKDGSKFCHKCGARYGDDAADQAVNAADNTSAPADSPVNEANTAPVSETPVQDAAAPEGAEGTGTSEEKTSFFDQTTDNGAAADTASQDGYDTYFAPNYEPKKKGSRKFLIIGAIAAAVVVALVCFFCSNTFKRTFYKPAKYYEYVEKKNAHRNLDQVAAWLELAGLDGKENKTMGTEDSFQLTVSDDILDSISDIAGEDLDFLKEISFSGQSTIYDDKLSGNLNLQLGSTQIVAINAISDAGEDTVYLRIPEISDDYLGFRVDNLEEMVGGRPSYDSFNEEDPLAYMDVINKLPQAAKLTKLASKYSDIVFENMDDVKKSKDTFEADGVKQKCWVLTVKYDYKDLKKLGKTLAAEIKKDKDLESIVKDLAESMDYDGDEAWDELVEASEELEDALPYLAGLKMKVYVDGKGHVIGREITGGEDYDELTVKYGRAIHGREFGAVFSADIDGDGVMIEGSGKKSGQNYSGVFTFSGTDIDPFKITLNSFDHKAFNKQRLVGEISVKLEDYADELDLDDVGLEMLEDYSVFLSVNSKDKSAYDIGFRVSDNKTDAIALNYSFKKTGGSKISIPTDAIMVEEPGDLKDYLEDADFDKIADNLEKAGVPESITEYIGYLNQLADYLDYYDY
ncbi:MAG: zinc-ribbon domain-containing protein [Lachnospiraceae bacterium]|nr:zinc-ribbon domain-containing protein [Lachnospiraceae bacterium]